MIRINKGSFARCSIISCGTLRLELNHLKNEGFLDAKKIFLTTPGLHELSRELERQLVRQIMKASENPEGLIVLYGDRCFVDSTDYFRGIDMVIREQGIPACRVKAHNCIDMLVSEEEREAIAGGRRVYWLSPGWIEYKKNVFLEWDVGKANETFPSNDAAILLDSIGYYDRLAEKEPEKLLEFSDWMGISLEPFPVSLDRLKGLLSSCLDALETGVYA